MNEHKFMLIGAGVALLAMLYLVKKKGAAAGAGVAVGTAAVDLVGGVTTGVVTGVSQAIGIPTPAETITDPTACQAYADENGTWSAIGKCGMPAFFGFGGSAPSAAPVQNSPAYSAPYIPSVQDGMIYGSD
jgi:hypothetical protein